MYIKSWHFSLIFLLINVFFLLGVIFIPRADGAEREEENLMAFLYLGFWIIILTAATFILYRIETRKK